MTLSTKTFSNISKFECSICNYKTNNKKDFKDHVFFLLHLDAVLKKNQASQDIEN